MLMKCYLHTQRKKSLLSFAYEYKNNWAVNNKSENHHSGTGFWEFGTQYCWFLVVLAILKEWDFFTN